MWASLHFQAAYIQCVRSIFRSHSFSRHTQFRRTLSFFLSLCRLDRTLFHSRNTLVLSHARAEKKKIGKNQLEKSTAAQHNQQQQIKNCISFLFLFFFLLWF